MNKISVIRKRRDFVLASSSKFFFRTDFFVIQCRKNSLDCARVGFTASKKVGNAVVRNRCKRRMRELARQLVPMTGLNDCDFVFIAKKRMFRAKWNELHQSCSAALSSLSEKIQK